MTPFQQCDSDSPSLSLWLLCDYDPILFASFKDSGHQEHVPLRKHVRLGFSGQIQPKKKKTPGKSNAKNFQQSPNHNFFLGFCKKKISISLFFFNIMYASKYRAQKFVFESVWPLKKKLSCRFWQNAEAKILAGPSRIARPAELNKMVQYGILARFAQLFPDFGPKVVYFRLSCV